MVAMVALLVGCRKDEPHGPGDAPRPPGWVGPSVVVETELLAAGRRYDALRETTDADAARAELVDELRDGWHFVSDAALTDDGTTVAILFRDGTTGIVETYEGLFGVAEGPLRGHRGRRRSAGGDAAPPGGAGCAPTATVPRNHKVLLINAASLSDAGSAWFVAELRDEILPAHGWTDADIEVVSRESLDDPFVTPKDLLETEGHGLVFYIGHGGSFESAEWSTPGHRYLQVGSYGDYSEALDAAELSALQDAWGKRMGPITFLSDVVGERTAELYIDTELFAEEAEVEPGAMAFFTSCNSDTSAPSFLEGGYTSAVTWSGKTAESAALEAYDALLDALLEGKALSRAHAELTPSQATSAAGGTVELAASDDEVFLPAWGELTIEAEDLPAGTDHLRLVVPATGGDRIYDDLQPGGVVSFDGLAPDTQARLQAVSSTGAVLETRAVALDVHPGGGNDLATPPGGVLGLVVAAHPSTVAADGVSAATIEVAVRAFEPGDLREPTGPGAECVQVEVSTTLGRFTGDPVLRTDASGVATVDLVSDVAGTAEVRAVAPEDGIESRRSAQVQFGVSMSRTGSIWPEGNPWVPDGAPDEHIYDTVFFVDDAGTERCYGTWTGWTNGPAGGCAACDQAWSFSFWGFRPHSGGCGSFGLREGEVQGPLRYGFASPDRFFGYDPDVGQWRQIGTAEWSEVDYQGELYPVLSYVTDWGEPSWR